MSIAATDPPEVSKRRCRNNYELQTSAAYVILAFTALVRALISRASLTALKYAERKVVSGGPCKPVEKIYILKLVLPSRNRASPQNSRGLDSNVAGIS
jgi:hypothetical protein